MRKPAGILFTDLDGTLLDHETYQPSDAAVDLVRTLASEGVVTVAVTSKTGAEVATLIPKLGVHKVAVVEGGGAVLRHDGSVRVLGRGVRDELIAALNGVASRGLRVRGAHQMDAAEFARRTGLSQDEAQLALTRHASEPFVYDGPDEAIPDLERWLASAGVSLTRGGRFWHLQHRGVDKAAGARAIAAELGLQTGGRTGGVGDAWNDLPLLEWVGSGYLLGNRVPDREVPPRVMRIRTDGPAGFAIAVADYARQLGLAVGGE